MPWTLVEDCSAPSVDRFGNRKLTLDVVASGMLSLSSRNRAPVVFQSTTPCLLLTVSIIKQAKPSLFGVCCSWFNPNSHHAVMFINSQEITRVDVRANCTCAIMRCKIESELKYNAFPDLCVGENVVDT